MAGRVVHRASPSGSQAGGAEHWSRCEETGSFTLKSFAFRSGSKASICAGFVEPVHQVNFGSHHGVEPGDRAHRSSERSAGRPWRCQFSFALWKYSVSSASSSTYSTLLIKELRATFSCRVARVGWSDSKSELSRRSKKC